jgi:hypothetical protein
MGLVPNPMPDNPAAMTPAEKAVSDANMVATLQAAIRANPTLRLPSMTLEEADDALIGLELWLRQQGDD